MATNIKGFTNRGNKRIKTFKELPEGLRQAIEELDREEVTEVTQEDWDSIRRRIQKRREKLESQ